MRNTYKWLFLFIFIYSCRKSDQKVEPQKYVLIVAGQSQAVGRAFNSEMDAEIASYSFSRTKIWTVAPDSISSRWVNSVAPNYNKITGWEQLNITKNQSFNQAPGTHGLEPSFAYTFEKTHPADSLFIIKFASGGTPLALDSFFYDWSYNSKMELYDFLTKSYLIPAFQSITNYRPLGFWWAQGESDGKDTIFGGAYYDNLTNFFQRIYTDVPQLAPFRKYIALATYFDNIVLPQIPLIRNAETKYCSIASNNAILINCDKAAVNPDNHFSARGFEHISGAIWAAINK